MDISEDLKSNNEIDIQELTDKYTKIIDDMFSSKEKDILTVYRKINGSYQTKGNLLKIKNMTK